LTIRILPILHISNSQLTFRHAPTQIRLFDVSVAPHSEWQSYLHSSSNGSSWEVWRNCGLISPRTAERQLLPNQDPQLFDCVRYTCSRGSAK